jgi:hypothetical protein
MSVVKTSDVKNRLSSRYRTKIQLCEPAGPSQATRYSGDELNATGASLSAFARNHAAEHASAVKPALSTANLANSTDSQMPETSRSARP